MNWKPGEASFFGLTGLGFTGEAFWEKPSQTAPKV